MDEIKVKMLRSLFVRGEMLAVGEVVSLSQREAHELVARGAAKEVQDDGIDESMMVAIDEMSKQELLEYAKELELEVPKGATKERLIELIEKHQEGEA